MKLRTILQIMCLTFTAGVIMAKPLGSIVDCEVTGKNLLFSAKARNCDAAEQASACDIGLKEPNLGPSKPIGCKTFDNLSEFVKAAGEAIKSRQNPKQKSVLAQQPAQAGQAVPQRLPVLVTCNRSNPTGGSASFIALGGSCEPAAKQKACDRYKSAPQIGPSVAGDCQSFTDVAELKKTLGCAVEQGRFPGLGGSVVSCKTRGEQKVYGVKGNNCQQQVQQAACETANDIADPIACTFYPTDKQVSDELAKLPKTSGLECLLNVGGTGYRTAAADCSEAVKNKLCKPQDGKVVSCETMAPDKLKEWVGEYLNDAMVTCQSKEMGVVTYKTLARSCDPEIQKTACGEFSSPVGCDIMGIEEKKREQAKQLSGQTEAPKKKGTSLCT